MNNIYLSDVELEDLLHIEGQLDEQHVPAPVGAGMGHQDSQEWRRRQHSFPGYSHSLEQWIKSK